MRLIDADALLEEINTFSMRITGSANAMAITVMAETKKSIANIVSEQPTAYDVDRVVEQLEECKRIMESPVLQDCYSNEECKFGDCTVCAFEKAIKIVDAEFERCGKPESEKGADD